MNEFSNPILQYEKQKSLQNRDEKTERPLRLVLIFDGENKHR